MKIIKTFIWILILILLSTSIYASDNTADTEKFVPKLNGTEKFNIGYAEAFNYSSYSAHLYGILVGLHEMGWVNTIDGIPYKSGDEDSKAIWDWLVKNQPSDYLNFPADGYYSFEKYEDSKEAVLDSTHGRNNNIDLLLCMGTSAGRTVTAEVPSIPVIIFSSTNAIASEIVESDTDSGKDNVWAHVDSKRYKKQVSVLHDIFKFEKLGIVYEDSIPGRSYADLDNVREICKELGVALVEKNVVENVNSEEYPRYYDDMKAICLDFADEVDAFYLTSSNLAADDLPGIFEPFYKNKIPVFSQLGGEEVRTGAIMSTAANWVDIGRYGAQIVSKSLYGDNPRYLYATYEDIPLIVLNMNNAKKIGYKPDFEILLIADKLYFDPEK